MKAKLAYIATIFVGLILSYNTNIFKPEVIQASEIPKTVTLPQIPGNFKLDLDLETGKANVESNLPIASTGITVNHPTKIVEKVVYKNKIKKVYETKTEYREKLLMFPLPSKKIHVPDIQIPTKVE